MADQSQIPAIPLPTFQPSGFSTDSTIGQPTLPLWPTPSSTDLCKPTSQRTSQGRQEQRWTQVQAYQPADRPRVQTMLQSLLPKPPIIHLAFFHGIGVSQLALQYLNVNIIRTFSWEIDPFCNELLDHRYHQQIEHMGDATQTDFPTFCRQLSDNYDNSHVILITSAPPCKDHSRVRDAPPGVSGSDGSLIQQMTNIDLTIRQHLPTYTIRSLMENVLPHHDIQEQFRDISNQWGMDPIVVDAADGQVTSRPRLWWLDAEWKYVSHQLTGSTPFTLHWTLQDGYHRLHNPIATMIQPSIHVKDWETPAVLCNKQLFHCLTTQAPTDLGRPPPAHAHADEATWERWQQDNRQFPPWQYQPQFLTRPHEGDWQPITPLQRERLMALPDNYTKITDQHPSTRTRNTMLGNAWHFPSALWLLTLLLMIPSSPALRHPPTQSNLQRLTGLWLSSQTPWGPPAKTTHHQHMPQLDWHSHLRWARTLQDPTADHSNLDPSLCWAINQSQCLPNIQQIRQLQQSSDNWSRNNRRPQPRGSNKFHHTANSLTNRQI